MDDDNARVDEAAPFTVADLDYELPGALIAQEPARRREEARLLVLDRAADRPRDAWIADLPGLLLPGDLLVLNDTKVLPAKFLARRKTGGAVPGLFILEIKPGEWRVLLQGSRRLRVGETLCMVGNTGERITLGLTESCGDGHWHVRVDAPGSAEQILDRMGQTPLPPYIRRDPQARERDPCDRSRYQTVYAKQAGAIAAPTAGLHLTESLLEAIGRRGVDVAFVTLHVGIGTFKPITVDDLSDHTVDAERYELPQETAEAVRACRDRAGRVVAVGTTSVRVLESAAAGGAERRLVAARTGTTGLFIYPPYRFRVVDAMLTNFHLPRTTLLALVMAMAGIENIRRAYRHAIERRYRFYSYGDAMLIQ